MGGMVWIQCRERAGFEQIGVECVRSYTFRGGERSVAAREYYRGPYDTDAKAGEILTSIRFPVPPIGHGHAYEKLKRKVGDYATAAAGMVLTMQGGRVAHVAIGLTNVGDTPLLADQAASILTGSTLDAAKAVAVAPTTGLLAAGED